MTQSYSEYDGANKEDLEMFFNAIADELENNKNIILNEIDKKEKYKVM